VDNGGTWIRLKGLDARGRCVWSLKKPSPTVEKLPGFLQKHLRRFRGRLDSLAVGSRGVWKPAKRRAMKRALRGLAKNIVVMSDVEAAWMAAFKDRGIIVVAGTGSIAYGRRADGMFARAGGLGPDKGDEGSGFWIGREWLRRQPAPSPRRKSGPSPLDWIPVFAGMTTMTVRKIASFAPLALRRAKEGNHLAREITQGAQQYLSKLVIDLILKLQWTGIVPLAVSGSVLENPWFQRGFLKRLHTKGIKFKIIRKTIDPAIAPLNVLLHP
jgi:glucosamine kinase